MAPETSPKRVPDPVWCHICNGVTWEVRSQLFTQTGKFGNFYSCRTCNNVANQKNHEALERRHDGD